MRKKNKIIVSCIEGSQKSEVWNCMYKYKTVEREKNGVRSATTYRAEKAEWLITTRWRIEAFLFSAAIVADLLNAVYTEDWIYFISPQFVKLKMVKENFKLNNKILNPISIPIKTIFFSFNEYFFNKFFISKINPQFELIFTRLYLFVHHLWNEVDKKVS